jgi:hypothetical protein
LIRKPNASPDGDGDRGTVVGDGEGLAVRFVAAAVGAVLSDGAEVGDATHEPRTIAPIPM